MKRRHTRRDESRGGMYGQERFPVDMVTVSVLLRTATQGRLYRNFFLFSRTQLGCTCRALAARGSYAMINGGRVREYANPTDATRCMLR